MEADLLKNLELLKEENARLKKELKALKKAYSCNQQYTFKEKFALKILNSLPDMLTVFDHNEIGIEVLSSEESNHIELSNEQFRGIHMSDMVPEKAYSNIHANLQKAIKTGEVSTSFHDLMVHGELRNYENRIFPLDNDYVLIMCRDITDTVTVQKNLKMFKNIQDCLNHSIFAVTTDGTIIYSNKQFIKEYGLDGKLHEDKIYNLQVSFNNQTLWEEKLKDIRNNGGSFSYTAPYFHNTQSEERTHQITAFLIKEENEEFVWFFTLDITDLIRKSEELERLNKLLEVLLDNLPVYMFVKNPENDFRYMYWNKAFTDFSGIEASNAIGHTDFEIFPKYEDALKFRQDDLYLLETKQDINLQETYITAKGDTRIVQTVKSLIPTGGHMPLIIGISLDITNMQSIEKELINARIKAEQSDRLKSAFLANMSHEIRTPLNAIVGFSNLLTEASGQEEKDSFCDIIKLNSDILLQLINDILDISKIEAGTLEYVRKTMNLDELCRNAYETHKNKVREGVKLIMDNPIGSIIIKEDYNRLTQVVNNLLTNASKFTLQGEIHLGYQEKEDFIEVYVKDTGIGISKEHKESIFGRFVKLNTFAQGTGLGLAICQMIVEKMGGTISVESEVNIGTIFRFTIPKPKTDFSLENE